MINKMPGYEVDKFKNLMAGYAFMMGHPGKKLLFMGQEFAQLQEWSEKRELDWYLLENPKHKYMQDWVKALLHLYQENKSMYELDHSWKGFEWINANDSYRSTYSFIRKSRDGKNNMVFVLNMTPIALDDYAVGVPKKGKYKLVLNSDEKRFAGNGAELPEEIKAQEFECDGRQYAIKFNLPPYGAVVYSFSY